MTLQSSGTITMAEINTEFSRGNDLNSYRGTTWWKDDASTGTFSSGAINFSDFYSTRVSAPGYPGNDSYTKLLLHLDGNFTDISGSPKSPSTQTATTSATQYKFGSQSGYYPGTTNTIYDANTDFNMTTGDFTVDAWLYPTAINATNELTAIGYGRTTTTTQWALGISSNGDGSTFQFLATCVNTSGTSFFLKYSSSNYTINTGWYHLCLVRSGNNFYFFLNGVQQGTTVTNSASLYNTGTLQLCLGRPSFSTSNSLKYIGYIDEIRISKGIARWTSNFTPPTLAYI